MSVTITTNDFIKTKSFTLVDKDGKELNWEYTAPGAGLSLELSRLAREITENKEASADEQTKMIETMFEYYGSILRDKTKNNSEVNKWLRETPIEAIGLIIAEIQKSE